MIIPRYSLRTILIIVTVCAVMFLVISLGAQGTQWAAGVSIGLLALAVALIAQALTFFLAWVFAVLLRSASRVRQRRDG